MAIVFNCPHCKTNYRLKDEFGGKTATCKNPDCRKVIPIPKAKSPAAKAPVDVDALAAAAFSDEAAKAAVAEATIPVTCAGCDHVWEVEASKEGKNVLCPECRRPNRVPLRKKEEKADWRTGGGGPSLAKRETGLDREGAFGNVAATGISQDTAREIVKGREAEEEPEERRKRRIRRGVYALVLLAVLGGVGYFALKTRREIKTEANMAQAVQEQKEQGSKDPRFEALIHRAAGEHRARTSGSAEDAAEAKKDLQLARNRAKPSPGAKGPDADTLGVLADVAVTFPHVLGTTKQVDEGTHLKKEDVVKELRQTLQAIPDAELAAEVVRRVTREFAKKDQPTLAEDVAHQLTNPQELVAQIGLELMRMSREPNGERYRAEAEGLLAKVANADTPGAHALRMALGKAAPPAKKGDGPAASSLAAEAEANALKGNVAGAKAARNIGRREDRAKALANIGETLLPTDPAEATPLLLEAAKALKDVGGTVSPWVSVRVCRLLARVGKVPEAEALAAAMPDEPTKAWGRLAVLEGRLEAMPGQKGDDTWLGPIGDPTKQAAAAKAHEVMARHNAAAGFAGEYQSVVKKWPPGTVRPFGMAGLILGQLDREGK